MSCESVRACVSRSLQLSARLGLWVGALLLTVSCMPAHVASDPPRDATTREPRERPSKTYHVQVRTVEEKSEADKAVSEVMTWFDALERNERPLPLSRVSTVPVDVRWKAPFYRVRVGPFTSKEAAESVLQSIQRRFPDAFIAKEVIKDEPVSRRTFWYETPRSGSDDDWNPDWNRGTDQNRGTDWRRAQDWVQREDWQQQPQRRNPLQEPRKRFERERDRESKRRRKRWGQQRGRVEQNRTGGLHNREKADDVNVDNQIDADDRASYNGDEQ